jgi:hypothetical protein
MDVETRQPVDILAERSADSFAALLAARPGAGVICRDRAGCYSDSPRSPDAIQVADHSHLAFEHLDAVDVAFGAA